MKTIETVLINGLKASKLTLGTVQIGMPYGIANKTGMPDESESYRMLDIAYEQGITSYDTAQGYGESERILGRYFSGKPKPTFISKLALQPEADDSSMEKHMMDGLESSLKHLQIDKLPVVLLHNPLVLTRSHAIISKTFERMKTAGLIEKAGVSFGADILNDYQALWGTVQDGLYEVIQVPLNILDQRLLKTGYLAEMKKAGKTIFARSIFLQGALCVRKAEDLPAHMKNADEALAGLHRMALETRLSVEQLAVSYVRDLEGIDSLVMGSETSDQIRHNIALMAGPRIERSLRERMLAQFRDVPENVINGSLWPKS